MISKTINPDRNTALFVKNILIFEDTNKNNDTTLPFFADGYPGLLFHDTSNGLMVYPHNKKMPALFLYGQTIKPVELNINGSYKLIVFQLYPFALKSLFGIAAKEINDDCYDLTQTAEGADAEKKTSLAKSTTQRITVISDYLRDIIMAKKNKLDFAIRQSIQLILESKAQISIKQVCEETHLTKRTFERRFLNEVGITAKQFSQIIKFQQSFRQLTVKDFTRLSDIVYENGYADQSHFIRVFKAYTGKTPKSFLPKNG